MTIQPPVDPQKLFLEVVGRPKYAIPAQWIGADFRSVYLAENTATGDMGEEFVEKLCEKSKEAISDFLEYYSDELYYIASKFNYRGMPQDSWEYRTKTGYSIEVSDEVAAFFKLYQKTSCC